MARSLCCRHQSGSARFSAAVPGADLGIRSTFRTPSALSCRSENRGPVLVWHSPAHELALDDGQGIVEHGHSRGHAALDQIDRLQDPRSPGLGADDDDIRRLDRLIDDQSPPRGSQERLSSRDDPNRSHSDERQHRQKTDGAQAPCHGVPLLSRPTSGAPRHTAHADRHGRATRNDHHAVSEQTGRHARTARRVS
jgi:hypothetical protein